MSGLSATSLNFLRTYARTQRFRVGLPSAFAVVPSWDDGSSASSSGSASVLFLRTADGEQAAQHLYRLDPRTSEESVLVRADDLVPSASGGEEALSDEEKKLRERKRLTSKGITSYQTSPTRPHETLIPYQQHLYLFDARTRKTINLTAGSTFEPLGPPSYPLFSPDGERLALVRAGDIFIVELLRGDAAAAAASSSSSSSSSASSTAAVSRFEEWRLTFTGTSVNPHSVNGIADFIAQEELGRFRGMWFAPDSKSLLFQHTDTADVEQLAIVDLAHPAEPPQRSPYPRPGKANAKVRMGLLQLKRPSAVPQPAAAEEAEPDNKKRRRTSSAKKAASAAAAEPATPVLAAEAQQEPVWLSWDAEAYPYVVNVVWSSAGAPLSLVLQSRLQNVTSLVVVDDLTTGATREIVQEREEPGTGWINVDHSVPHWLGGDNAASNHFLWSSEQPSGYLSLTLHDRSGKRVRVLHDPETVMYRKLLSVDEKAGVAYVLGGPCATEQHVWRIPLGFTSGNDGIASLDGPLAPPKQLTTEPAIHNGAFSVTAGLWVHESHSLADGSRFAVRRIPPVQAGDAMQVDESASASALAGSATSGTVVSTIKSVALQVPAEHLPRVQLLKLEANERLAWEELKKSNELIAEDAVNNPLTRALADLVPKKKSLLAYKPGAEPEPSSFATHTYNVAVLRPHGASVTDRFPVVVYTYGGPGHRLVTQDRSTWMIAQWVANCGFIVVTTDNRGTPFRGRAWEQAIAGDVQTRPLIDQVAVVKALAARDASLDISGRVGMFGWSFGGYMSALAACRYPSLFGATFVGAPVCDWRDYDTAYTERYLGLPLEREADYERSSVLSYAGNLLRPLLLVHGYTDDNVYVAHAIQMSDAFFKHGREHTFLPLAGTHMLADPMATINMYARLALHFLQHIRPSKK